MAAGGNPGKVIGVARFSEAGLLDKLRVIGVETIQADLLEPGTLGRLPDAANVIYLAGRKFGSVGSEHLTWALNAIVPCLVAGALAAAPPAAARPAAGGRRVVVFSTGCVYPLMHVSSGGATEATPPGPVGEYAMSCLARERVFEHFSRSAGLKVLLLRLNYAVELRYGVLVDLALKVQAGQPVDVTTGYANVLWQGDVCERALRCLALAASPPRVLNLTGPETFSVRQVALEFGRLLGKEVTFAEQENGLGYLSDAAAANTLFGSPTVPLGRVIEWTADWVRRGGPTLGKPTHFETQDGRY